MELYGYEIQREKDLSHHGILGMKWGKQNGPPYPLDAKDHSASEKKAGWRKSLSSNDIGEVHKEHHEKVMQIKESSMSEKEKEIALKEEQDIYDKKVSSIQLSNENKEKIKKALIVTGVVGITAAAAVIAVRKSGLSLNDIKYAISGADNWLQNGGKLGNYKLYTNAHAGAFFANQHLWSDRLWDNSLTSSERNAVKAYTGSAYQIMNKILRTGSMEGTVAAKNGAYVKTIQDVTSALRKASLPEDVMVHRGVGSLNSLAKTLGIDPKILGNPAQAKALIGQSFIDPAFGSTGMSTADAWAGVKLHIKLPKGSQAMWLDPISMVQGEHEILINRNARYVISDIRFGLDGKVEDVLVELIEHVL